MVIILMKIEAMEMFSKLSPKTIMYLLIGLLIIAVPLHVATNDDRYTYVVILVAGLVGILKPKIILEFFEQESKQGNSIMEPWFSEKAYKIIGFGGGLFLTLVALARLVLNIRV